MPKYRANESRAKHTWAMPSAADIQRKLIAKEEDEVNWQYMPERDVPCRDSPAPMDNRIITLGDKSLLRGLLAVGGR